LLNFIHFFLLGVCPVLCSGRGQYLNGECVCSSGWKGKECQLREDECEVNDCNGHGDCVDGSCHCFPGYKAKHCEDGILIHFYSFLIQININLLNDCIFS
jgi:hypothetical protein